MKSRECAGILPGFVRGNGEAGDQNLKPIPTLVERFCVVQSLHGGTPWLRWRIAVVPRSNRAMVRGVG